jgi:hypothetical protein
MPVLQIEIANKAKKRRFLRDETTGRDRKTQNYGTNSLVRMTGPGS